MELSEVVYPFSLSTQEADRHTDLCEFQARQIHIVRLSLKIKVDIKYARKRLNVGSSNGQANTTSDSCTLFCDGMKYT